MTMTQERLAQLIAAYGADPARWPADERAAATTLLAATPSLTAQADSERSLDRLLDLATGPADTGSLADQVLARLERETKVAPVEMSRPRWRRWVPLAASYAALLLAGFVLGQVTRGTPTAATSTVTVTASEAVVDWLGQASSVEVYRL